MFDPDGPDVSVSVPATVLAQTMPDGETAFVNLESEEYFGLNEVGTDMWVALTETSSVGEAYERLLSQYEVAPDRLREDLEELISSLESKGLIEVHEA